MTFKAAFVRHTIDHEVIAPSVYGFAALALLPIILKHERDKPARYLAGATVALMLFVTLPISLPLELPLVTRYPVMLASNVIEVCFRAEPCLNQLTGKNPNLEKYEKRMAEIREKSKLPKIEGAVDLYPALCNVPVACGLDYRQRPVFQSYLAYTQELAKLNQNHLQSDRAASTLIIQDMSDLYGYYPMLYDGPSWVDMLAYYEPVSRAPGGLILKKRNQVLKAELRPLEAKRARLGDTVSLDAYENKLLFTKINVAISPIGSLQKLFFRVFPPTITVTLSDGSKKEYIAPSDIMKAGFLLSPFAVSPDDIDKLFLREPNSASSNEIISMSISEKDNELPWSVFAPDYTIELYELVLE